jgi:hypothetical protein
MLRLGRVGVKLGLVASGRAELEGLLDDPIPSTELQASDESVSALPRKSFG